MIFAVIDEGWATLIGAVCAGIVGILAAVAGWYGKGWKATQLVRDRRNKTSVNEYQDILDRSESQWAKRMADEKEARTEGEEQCAKRLDRMQAQVDDQQRAINRLFMLYVESVSMRIEDYSLMASYHAGWSRANERLGTLGHSTERIADLPPRPTRDREGEAEFIRNQSQQNTMLVTEAAKGATP